MGKKKKNKKNKKKNKRKASLKRILQQDLPLYGAWINKDWQSSGFAIMWVARKQPTGLIVFVYFAMDLVNNKVENVFGEFGVPLQAFHDDYIENPRIDMEFFQAELPLVQRTIASALLERPEENEEPLKKHGYIHILGDLSKAMEELKQQQKEPTSVRAYPIELVFQLDDREEVEAEMRQMTDFEEVGSSSSERRIFSWKEERITGFLIRKTQVTDLADVIIENERAIIGVRDKSKVKYLQDKFGQLMGTKVTFQETRDNKQEESSSEEPQ